MDIHQLRIYKVEVQSSNVEEIDSSAYGEDLTGYLRELFRTVISNSSGRTFYFDRSTTEVRAQISRINNGEDFSDISLVVANRLLAVESEAQESMNKLGITIQQGILVQALIQEGEQSKFIICKADHSEFLNDFNYQRSRGLPIKKKAFKAFVCGLQDGDTVDDILIYDTNSSDTQYWWKGLLELTMVHSDEDNTATAFNAIDKGVFNKIKSDFPQDYTYLRNSAIRYFRSHERFEMQDFLDNAIGNYEPINQNLNVNELREKIEQLPHKPRARFDRQFNIVRSKVNARFSRTVVLTPAIDLHIKGDFAENTIMAERGENGELYVKIRSDEGYRYFKSNETNQ